MQRAPARVDDARRALARRWAVVALAVAALALVLAPLCSDGMPMHATPGAAATHGDGHVPTAMHAVPPADCTAPEDGADASCGGVTPAPVVPGAAPGLGGVLLVCLVVLVAVLVALLGLRAPPGPFRALHPSASPIGWTRRGLPAPRPVLARLCVLRT